MVFDLKNAGKGSKNGLEAVKMLDFEFFRALVLKGPYLNYFKIFFSRKKSFEMTEIWPFEYPKKLKI
jgi:hypothetical protein